MIKTGQFSLLLLVITVFFASSLKAQGLEGIIVEKYYDSGKSSSKKTSMQPGLITYRIFVDLATGYHLQAVLGTQGHPFCIQSTSVFFNHPEGSIFGDSVNSQLLNEPGLAFDSWISFGAASDRHLGVPLTGDLDGSILKSIGFKNSDGLVASEISPSMLYKLEPDIFRVSDSKSFQSSDFLIGKFGGIKGATDKNQILIAQLTTGGELSFLLNVQVGSDNNSGSYKVYVAQNPKDNEELFEELTFGRCILE